MGHALSQAQRSTFGVGLSYVAKSPLCPSACPVLDECERLCARYHVSATEISLYLNATRSNTGEKTEIKSQTQTHIGTGQ